MDFSEAQTITQLSNKSILIYSQSITSFYVKSYLGYCNHIFIWYYFICFSLMCKWIGKQQIPYIYYYFATFAHSMLSVQWRKKNCIIFYKILMLHVILVELSVGRFVVYTCRISFKWWIWPQILWYLSK